jgi:hypothetical protein
VETKSLWNGFIEMMRLNSFTGPLRRGEEDRKNKEKEQKASVKEYSWGETEIDQILRKVDDYNLSVEVKIERDKTVINQVFVTGSSSSHLGVEKSDIERAKEKNCLFSLKALRNRKVYQVSCGESHCIAVVAGCSCINPASNVEICQVTTDFY